MSHIHFAGAILQATQVQRQQEIHRNRDLRRAQELEEEIALQDDQLEHQVESTEEASRARPAGEDTPPTGRREEDNPPDEHPRLDIVA